MLKAVMTGFAAIVASGVAVAQQAMPAEPLRLFFDWSKPDVRSDDQTVLDQAVAAWRAHSGSRLMLSGHTDRSGSTAVNLLASRRRAETVRAELVRRGVPASAIKITAYGEGRPLVPTEDDVREVQNRRVEIALISGN